MVEEKIHVLIVMDNNNGLAVLKGNFNDEDEIKINRIRATFESTEEQDSLLLDLPDGAQFTLGLTEFLAKTDREYFM